ncbi:hypothetical protein HOU00_gp337 [Caulobacter phage CcrPW]|uniref:Uncharacterized protein n=1 Tax=Caulobacter phage CcrPW TaxID=2283271 RepID=A0A385EDH1_9CAUD|nr:hypothetical protein HOU00_gp337 [Caulobacter phage CcrPW]AXQ68788.1 hypothetical protein CcrPW_gp249c [Caulobacter phage CcrPW]
MVRTPLSRLKLNLTPSSSRLRRLSTFGFKIYRYFSATWLMKP